MEFTIDHILRMQDTIINVRRRTQELTISEIASREIDPVLFILLLTTVQFPVKRTNGKLSRVLRS